MHVLLHLLQWPLDQLFFYLLESVKSHIAHYKYSHFPFLYKVTNVAAPHTKNRIK